MFNCNRSGTYKPVSSEKRKRKGKSQGSRKIGQCCPARMVLNEATVMKSTGRITHYKLDAILDHYGHDCDLNHVSFSKEERTYLKGKSL